MYINHYRIYNRMIFVVFSFKDQYVFIHDCIKDYVNKNDDDTDDEEEEEEKQEDQCNAQNLDRMFYR